MKGSNKRVINLLTKRLTEGDHKAFKEIYDFYVDDILLFSTSILGSREDAKEILQIVFIKLWNHRKHIDPNLNFKSYLLTITKNESLNFIKSRNRRRSLNEQFGAERRKHTKGKGYDNLREEELELLKSKWLNLLSNKKKKIFLMSRDEGKSYAEISKELGLSINTVKAHMYKTLSFFRKRIEDDMN